MERQENSSLLGNMESAQTQGDIHNNQHYY